MHSEIGEREREMYIYIYTYTCVFCVYINNHEHSPMMSPLKFQP